MEKNPIVEVYKGVNIRHCNRVIIKMGIANFKRIIDASESTGLSIPKVLAYSGKPCETCKDIDVVVHKDKKDVKIKRGLLSVPSNNGSSIVKRNSTR